MACLGTHITFNMVLLIILSLIILETAAEHRKCEFYNPVHKCMNNKSEQAPNLNKLCTVESCKMIPNTTAYCYSLFSSSEHGLSLVMKGCFVPTRPSLFMVLGDPSCQEVAVPNMPKEGTFLCSCTGHLCNQEFNSFEYGKPDLDKKRVERDPDISCGSNMTVTDVLAINLAVILAAVMFLLFYCYVTKRQQQTRRRKREALKVSRKPSKLRWLKSEDLEFTTCLLKSSKGLGDIWLARDKHSGQIMNICTWPGTDWVSVNPLPARPRIPQESSDAGAVTDDPRCLSYEPGSRFQGNRC